MAWTKKAEWVTRSEKIRGYIAEPVIASLVVLAASHLWSFAQLSDFMHAEAKDFLSFLEILLGAAFALWIGLFWVSNTEFGSWLSEKGELQEMHNTYVFSVICLFIATIGCIPAAYFDAKHLWTQNIVLWIVLSAILNIPSLLNNTRNLLRLHAVFNQRLQKVKPIRNAAEN